jgi:hypothetical protein
MEFSDEYCGHLFSSLTSLNMLKILYKKKVKVRMLVLESTHRSLNSVSVI